MAAALEPDGGAGEERPACGSREFTVESGGWPCPILNVPPGEPEVRKHLVEQWRDFYVLMVRTLLDGSE